MLSIKTVLLGAVAAVSLGGAAHAAETILATSGVWDAHQFLNDNGTSTCTLQTSFREIGRHVVIGAGYGKNTLRIIVLYDGWTAPQNFATRLDLVFDGGSKFFAGDDNENNAWASKDAVILDIASASAPAFVHAFTAGYAMLLTVGNATPLSVSLTGTTAVWGPFMDCVKTASPAIFASIVNPTAVAASSPPAAVAAPPAVPVMPAAPVLAARQPAISEVGLLTNGGVKHVRGVAGSNTAVMFILDSGASGVQLPRDVAGQLALEGVLVATGRTKIFVDANGVETPKPVYILRSLTVGERTVTNIECNVTDNGDPLLGQSFLGPLTSWSIDNSRQMLVLGEPIV